jgi:hypothetical protein
MDREEIDLLPKFDGGTAYWECLSDTLLTLYLPVMLADGNKGDRRYPLHALSRDLLAIDCDEGRFFIWAGKLTAIPILDDDDESRFGPSEGSRRLDAEWPGLFQACQRLAETAS